MMQQQQKHGHPALNVYKLKIKKTKTIQKSNIHPHSINANNADCAPTLSSLKVLGKRKQKRKCPTQHWWIAMANQVTTHNLLVSRRDSLGGSGRSETARHAHQTSGETAARFHRRTRASGTRRTMRTAKRCESSAYCGCITHGVASRVLS